MVLYACKHFWIVGDYELYNYFRNGEEFSEKLGLSPSAVFSYTTTEDLYHKPLNYKRFFGEAYYEKLLKHHGLK